MTDRAAPARPYRICFVCTGNICRSPMAEAVMRGLLEEAGLDHAVEVDSAGTTSWHVGDPADRRALTALRVGGYDGSAHRARAFERSWLADRDLVVALDAGHLDELRALAGDGPHAPRSGCCAASSEGLDEGRADLGDLDVADPTTARPPTSSASSGRSRRAAAASSRPGARRCRPSRPDEPFRKSRSGAPDGFFGVEAAGLRWLAAAGGASVVEPLSVGATEILLPYVRQRPPTPAAADAFGAALAPHPPGRRAAPRQPARRLVRRRLHRDAGPPPHRGRAGRRVGPVLRRPPLTPYVAALDADGDVRSTRSASGCMTATRRLTGPPEPPARLHGDLWSGNVLWGATARCWSTRPRTAVTARPTWRCWRSSACRTWTGCWPPTTRPTPWPTAGGTASRCTSCTRCSCTPPSSAAATAPGAAALARRLVP